MSVRDVVVGWAACACRSDALLAAGDFEGAVRELHAGRDFAMAQHARDHGNQCSTPEKCHDVLLRCVELMEQRIARHSRGLTDDAWFAAASAAITDEVKRTHPGFVERWQPEADAVIQKHSEKRGRA